MVLPIIYWAGTRGDVADTSAYRQGFLNTASSLSSIPQAIAGDGKDKGFTVLNIILKAFIGERDVIYLNFLLLLTLNQKSLVNAVFYGNPRAK